MGHAASHNVGLHNSGSLPMTGFNIGILLLIAVTLIAFGYVLHRQNRVH